MSHTPGPWTVTKLLAPYSEDNDYPGAEVSFVDGGVMHDGAIQVWSERAEADANLIAAAPALIEAARITEQHFARTNASGGWQGDDEHEAWGLLRAAIAKAEGR